MKNDLFNTEIDEIIRASMKLADEPDPELNNKLKATLYQKEAAMQKQPATRGFSLWYLPMILNLVTFIMLAGVALMFCAFSLLFNSGSGSSASFIEARMISSISVLKRSFFISCFLQSFLNQTSSLKQSAFYRSGRFLNDC